MLFAVIGQLTTTSPSSSSIDINGGLVVVVVAIQLVFAALPAFIASRKGYSFALFFLFGFFCWLPAVIVAAVISSKKIEPGGFGYSYGPSGPGPVWSGAGAYAPPTVHQPVLPPPGWYPDPGGSSQQRYWDGTSWTEHLH